MNIIARTDLTSPARKASNLADSCPASGSHDEIIWTPKTLYSPTHAALLPGAHLASPFACFPLCNSFPERIFHDSGISNILRLPLQIWCHFHSCVQWPPNTFLKDPQPWCTFHCLGSSRELWCRTLWLHQAFIFYACKTSTMCILLQSSSAGLGWNLVSLDSSCLCFHVLTLEKYLSR